MRARQQCAPASFGTPAISPDGRWVVYAQDKGRERNLVMPLEGDNPPCRADSHGSYDAPLGPDNRRIAFASADSLAGGVIMPT
jgi:Tol biopolymer transport system component